LSCWRVIISPALRESPDRYEEAIDPHVQCSTCEAVCCRLTVVLMPEDHVPAWLVDHDEHGLKILAKGEDGWCAAVDPNTFACTIYADRPGICRKYAMGSPSCREERHKWFGATIPTAVHVL
jgi:Fe-S-cluster containining protein